MCSYAIKIASWSFVKVFIHTIILNFNYMIDRIELGKSEDILGEFNPGFSLWTSAHGFSHFRLSESKNWRRFWGVVIILAVIGLLSSFIFYSYQVKIEFLSCKKYNISFPDFQLCCLFSNWNWTSWWVLAQSNPLWQTRSEQKGCWSCQT